MTAFSRLTATSAGIAFDILGFARFFSGAPVFLTRDEAAAKWKCSAGTIDKYAS